MNGEPRTTRSWLPWLCAAAVFVVTLPVAGDVLDVPIAATPLVAVAAAVPLGLIATLPALGWLLSAGTALLVSRASDAVVDGDPWPWPTTHGLVLLALLFATGLQPRPWSRSPGHHDEGGNVGDGSAGDAGDGSAGDAGDGSAGGDSGSAGSGGTGGGDPADSGGQPRRSRRSRRSRVAGVLGDLAVPVVATGATAFLFAASAPDDLRAGWTTGAALVGVAGIVTGAVARRVPALQAFRTQPHGAVASPRGSLAAPRGSLAAPGGSLRSPDDPPAPGGYPVPPGGYPVPPGGYPVPPGDLPRLLRAGLRRAVLDWRPPPSAEASSRVLWVRRYVPWLAAFAVFWTATASIEASVRIHPLLVPIAGVAIALPVGLVDRYPLVGWRLATVLGVVLVLLGPPRSGEYDGAWPVIFQWSWLAAMYFVAVRYDRWTTVCAWAITVAAMLTGTGDNAGTAVTMIVAATAVAVIGDLVRARRSTSRDLERQTELSELEKARRTVLEERSRIARDLHDVVAHHMSMVVVQAETAPYRIDGLSDAARAEFTSISGSARQALDEIRGLLGVLRGTDETVALAPQPGLAQLGDLVDGARRSGVTAELTTAGTPPAEVPATVGLSAYRIAQESLANAVRHAPGSEVAVRVSYTARSVELRISNTAPAASTNPAAEASGAAGAGPAHTTKPVHDANVVRDAGSATGANGHGLPGMRERAAAVGGTVTAGPTPDGGFEVTAALPYRAAASAEEDEWHRQEAGADASPGGDAGAGNGDGGWRGGTTGEEGGGR